MKKSLIALLACLFISPSILGNSDLQEQTQDIQSSMKKFVKQHPKKLIAGTAALAIIALTLFGTKDQQDSVVEFFGGIIAPLFILQSSSDALENCTGATWTRTFKAGGILGVLIECYGMYGLYKLASAPAASKL